MIAGCQAPPHIASAALCGGCSGGCPQKAWITLTLIEARTVDVYGLLIAILTRLSDYGVYIPFARCSCHDSNTQIVKHES